MTHSFHRHPIGRLRGETVVPLTQCRGQSPPFPPCRHKYGLFRGFLPGISISNRKNSASSRSLPRLKVIPSFLPALESRP